MEETARPAAIITRGNARVALKTGASALKCGKRAVMYLDAVRSIMQHSAACAANFPAIM